MRIKIIKYKHHFRRTRMLKFSPISLSDKSWIEPYLVRLNCRVCDYSFTSLFLWKHLYQTECTQRDGFLLIRFVHVNSDKYVYLEPIGEGDLSNILILLQKESQNTNQPLRLESMSSSFVEKIKELPIGETLFFFKNRDLANYLYEAKSLCTLPGKLLRAKRSHVQKFERLYPQYKSRPLTADDDSLALSLFDSWVTLKTDCQELEIERQVIKTAFSDFEALHLAGLLLLVDEEPVAFTFGGSLCKDTFCIHVEKANLLYHGAYAMINKLMAQFLCEKYTYINREEDMGIENLRKAKLSYYPIELLDRLQAIQKDSDEIAVWKLWQTCFDDTNEFLVSYMFPYSNKESRVLLFEEGKLLAMFHAHSFSSDWGNVGYLYGLGTEPEHRGKGLAGRVIKESLKRIKDRGQLAAWIIQENKDFNSWETKFGFGPMGSSTLSFETPDGFDFGGDPQNDWGLCRVLIPELYLQKYADMHALETADFNFYDSVFPENSGHYSICQGRASFTPIDLPKDAKSLLPQDLLAKFPLDGGTELKYIVKDS